MPKHVGGMIDPSTTIEFLHFSLQSIMGNSYKVNFLILILYSQVLINIL